ncbi:hypothetical protein [Spirosoma agri]|uniref:Uncharacterized protein n=1 Tax=Spirosoma agri TaxID=1987381 RepID=A0A6M0IMW5_9BACT|nr:hypothetical protein [Spirosoma agri]NEU69670.1 hypothetical protein [Spirosoma agri]
MAHFFDAATALPLVDCPLQVGQKRAIGLFGGDFYGNDLGVIVDQSLVRMQEKTRKYGMRYFDLTALKPGQTILHAYAGIYEYALPIPVNVTKKMSTPQGKLAQRQGIVDEARSHVGKAHYLWGSAGNTPGLSDGAQYKPATAKMLTDSFAPNEPYVQTAFTDINGRNTCAGSCNNFPQLTVQEVNDFLRAGTAVLQNKVTPRTYSLKGKIKPIGKANNGIVWGEPCAGRKHFDCIGFVNYCIAKFWAPKTAFGLDIKVLMTNPNMAGFVEVTDPTDVLNGDVIGQYNTENGWHHIGLVYMSGKTAKVVQAADSPIGVTDSDDYKPSSWSKRIRLMDNLL